MTNRISDFDDLPEWFRKTDYLAAKSFSAFDWYFHAASRLYVLRQDSSLEYIIEHQHDPARSKSRAPSLSATEFETWRSMLDLQIEIIRKYTAKKIPKNTSMRDLGPAFALLLHPLNTASFPPIKRATLLDIYHSLRSIPENTKNVFVEFVANDSLPESDAELQVAQCDQWSKSPVVDLHSKPGSSMQLDFHSFGLFRANMWLPDDVLIESFRQMLRDTRSEEQRSSADLDNTTKSRRRKWIDYGVLPYLDLKFWSKQENRQISSGFLALAFAKFSAIRDPQCKYSSSTIDTTVKDYATQMLSVQTIHRLQAEAQSEIEARTPE